jgi:hypothetical protein
LTECISLSPLTDDDLLAALDGEADGRIQNHLQACAYCSARLEHMRKFEQGVHTIMYRSDCPSTDELADYVMKETSFDSPQKLEQHLSRCVLCSQEVQNLQMVLAVEEEFPEEVTPSPPIWDQVKHWLEDLEEQLVSVLVPRQLAAPQLRGADDRERILNYEHESVTVMLRLEKVVDGLKINGTIIDNEHEGLWAGGHTELSAAEQGRFLAIIDEDENFTINQIPPGLFQLNIYAVTGRVLRLNDIDLTV